MLIHTTSWDQRWGGDETLNSFTLPDHVKYVLNSASPYLIDPIPRSLRLTQNAYFSLLAHTKKLLLMKYFVIRLQELEV